MYRYPPRRRTGMPCDCRPRFCDFAPPHARPVDRRGRRRRRKRAAASSARAAPVATVHGRRLHNIAQVGSASPAVCLKSIPGRLDPRLGRRVRWSTRRNANISSEGSVPELPPCGSLAKSPVRRKHAQAAVSVSLRGIRHYRHPLLGESGRICKSGCGEIDSCPINGRS